MIKDILLMITVFFILFFIESIFPSMYSGFGQPGDTLIFTLPILIITEWFLISRIIKNLNKKEQVK